MGAYLAGLVAERRASLLMPPLAAFPSRSNIGSGFRFMTLIRVLHDFNSEDLEKILPGENFDLGRKSEPGTFLLWCKYHVPRSSKPQGTLSMARRTLTLGQPRLAPPSPLKPPLMAAGGGPKDRASGLGNRPDPLKNMQSSNFTKRD